MRHPSVRWLEAVSIAVFLSSVLFLWQWKYDFNLGDEGLQWYISQRIKFGDMPIRDVFGYDPGRYLWSALWFKILGADGLFEQRLANTAFGIIGLISAYISMLGARVGVWTRIVVAGMLAIALCYPLHKVYEQSLSLIGVALVACALRHPTDRRCWLALGIGTGIAACIGRNTGVFFAIAAFAAIAATWRLRSRQDSISAAIAYTAGTLAGYSPMLIWFAVDSRFRQAMIESILFTPHWQLPLPIPLPWRISQNFSSVQALQATMVGWLVVLTLALYAMHALETLKRIVSGKVLTPLVSLEVAALYVGLPYLYQSFDRADFPHIAQGILPLFLLASTKITKPCKTTGSVLAALFLIVAMLAWIPVEPAIRFWLLQRQNPFAIGNFPIDGHNFKLLRSTEALLSDVRHVAESCDVKDDQMVAMPHFPGLLAYMHLRSPYWEMYYLYRRDEAFQRNEINRMETFGTKLAVVDWSTELDNRKDLRFAFLNPILAAYITTKFKSLYGLASSPSDVSIMVRNCSLLKEKQNTYANL